MSEFSPLLHYTATLLHLRFFYSLAFKNLQCSIYTKNRGVFTGFNTYLPVRRSRELPARVHFNRRYLNLNRGIIPPQHNERVT